MVRIAVKEIWVKRNKGRVIFNCEGTRRRFSKNGKKIRPPTFR